MEVRNGSGPGEAGTPGVAVAPEEDWGLEPHRSVGSPFAVPEPVLLAPRHLPRRLLDGRAAYLRVVEGLPECYVLVERSVLSPGDTALPADLDLALTRLAEGAGGGGARPRWCGCRPGRSARTRNSKPPFASAGRKQRKGGTSPRTGPVTPGGRSQS